MIEQYRDFVAAFEVLQEAIHGAWSFSSHAQIFENATSVIVSMLEDLRDARTEDLREIAEIRDMIFTMVDGLANLSSTIRLNEEIPMVEYTPSEKSADVLKLQAEYVAKKAARQEQLRKLVQN